MDARHTEDVSIIYLNIGSLPAHIDELQNFLFTSNCYPTIIALAETKITQTVNTEFHPHLDSYMYLNIASSISGRSVGVFIKKILIIPFGKTSTFRRAKCGKHFGWKLTSTKRKISLE